MGRIKKVKAVWKCSNFPNSLCFIYMFGSLANVSLAHAPLQREPVGGAYADGVVLRRVGAEV